MITNKLRIKLYIQGKHVDICGGVSVILLANKGQRKGLFATIYVYAFFNFIPMSIIYIEQIRGAGIR